MRTHTERGGPPGWALRRTTREIVRASSSYVSWWAEAEAAEPWPGVMIMGVEGFHHSVDSFHHGEPCPTL
jgi:hypothetical protein